MISYTIKEKINEELLCVLKKDCSNKIVIDYVDIVNLFKPIVDELTDICDNPETTIEQIINYIQNTKDFEQLSTYYRYCIYLDRAFEGFNADNQGFLLKIDKQYQELVNNRIKMLGTFQQRIKDLKLDIKNTYILWSKAYAINKTYKLCLEDKSVFAFSHRIDGWSNPVYQLTPNFSIQIKTNFGYGQVSYFYTKLKYKNIEITPFSEWIEYEFASFSQIIRYTQSHLLANESWLEAMEYSRDACNLSLTDEVKFVEKYVIDECEKMVSGLEELFNKEHFTFINRERKNYSVDKKGHVLVGFRGEKISGALDFISKILEFDSIAAIKTFVTRIEACNKRIQPILVEEAEILKIKIECLTKEKNELQPKYDDVVRINKDYSAKRRNLQAEMISKGKLKAIFVDTQIFEIEFNKRFPEYTKFIKEYMHVTEKYRILTEQIQNNTNLRDKIVFYNKKITAHFED